MKTAIVICLIVLLTFGCGLVIYGGITDASISEVAIETAPKTGEIGAFSAVTPANNATLTSIPAFTWTEAENADTYTLEIASDDEFDIADDYYIVKSGITTTTFNLQADFKKDKHYFWRVTAKNEDHSELISGDALTFFYQATLYDEIPVSIGYADEWKVHEVGSKATVSLDHNSFFGEKGNAEDMAAKKDSLRISFDSEDTQRGPEYVESNGWVVVTRSLEAEFYGPDAFYFNFYYSGNDATAYFRLIDEDNEYWYAPIKLAVNAKQTIIMRISDFTLRTKGTPVVNEQFDYHYLKSMEIVFERVDGDGVAYFGNLKAIKYENYQDMVIDSLDFDREGYTYTNDSAYFNFERTVGDEGDSFTYAFTTRTGVPDNQKGYGFVKMYVNKILASSDAFSFNVGFFNADHTAMTDKSFNFLLRIVEEDNDVWTFKILAKDIPADGNLLVPFSAFLLSEFKGDGIRQFYFIKQFQFGLNNRYSDGEITISNFDIVLLSDKVEDLYKSTVGADGMIDEFENYESVVDVYYKWEPTTANKDEQISLNSASALGRDTHAARFYYKTDLSDAAYVTHFDSVEGYSAIEFYARDVSNGSFKATMTVYLIGGPNELYSYELKNIDKEWINYVIPISEFNITADSFGSQHITCENITGIALAFKYSFTRPEYASGSFVSVDKIRFSNATEVAKTELSGKIKMAQDNTKAMISDFDTDNADVVWSKKEDTGLSQSEVASNTAATINTEQTASGEGRSLQLAYKTRMVAPYCAYMVVDSGVTAKGLTLLLKGDGRPDTYVEVIVYVNSKAYKKRIDVATSGWNYYSIGFSEFKYNGTSEGISASSVGEITQIALYIKNYAASDYYAGTLYLDEIYFDNTITTSTNTVTAYV